MLLDGFPALASLVERRLQEAAAAGELSNLPGEGRPLDLEDDALVPPELRVAYRIVKNAGLLPPELSDIAEVQQLIGAIGRADAAPGSARLHALLARLEASGRHCTVTRAWQDYEGALQRRLARKGAG